MLIVSVYVNEKRIDNIFIHNMGYVDMDKNDMCEYRIEHPEIYKDIPILHYRKDGWAILLEKVLKIMNSSE